MGIFNKIEIKEADISKIQLEDLYKRINLIMKYFDLEFNVNGYDHIGDILVPLIDSIKKIERCEHCGKEK